MDLVATKAQILKHLKTIEHGLQNVSLDGIISDQKRGEHIRTSFSLKGRQIERSSSTEELAKIQLWASIRGQQLIAEMCRRSVRLCKPLYIGLAEKQSIRDRITSHYNLNSKFGKKVNEAKFGWNVVGYGFISVERTYYSQSNMRDFEKMLQRLTNPVFSEV